MRTNSKAGSRVLIGINPDLRKIKNAKSGVDRDGSTEKFLNVEIHAISSESIDCITVMDVRYLLPLDRWSHFPHHCVRVLKPAGFLVIKEVHDRPKWKLLISYFQELFSIYVSRMTQGNHPHFQSIDTYRQRIEGAGASVAQV
jgi:2-polyprenyl-3-methyl-5-hydroxy-6-metoxy-1,4-benzoquinol methylase